MSQRRAPSLNDPSGGDGPSTASDRMGTSALDAGAATSFYAWEGPRRRVDPADPTSWMLPVFLHRVDGFWSVHAAQLDAVAASLPSDLLHPVRLPDGRAVVMLAVFQKREVTDGNEPGRLLPPYAEVMIAAAVTLAPMSRLERLLMAAGRLPSEVGGFVLHLPCTSGLWRDGARRSAGAPMFVADLAFSEGTAERRVCVSDGGADILTLAVRPRGRVLHSRQAQVLYTSHEGQLLRLPGRLSAYQQQRRGSAGGDLWIGDGHPVARDLQRLGLSPTSLMSGNWISVRAIMGAGEPVGEARPYEGWRGCDREWGRYTVTYPGTCVIDEGIGGQALPAGDAAPHEASSVVRAGEVLVAGRQ